MGVSLDEIAELISELDFRKPPNVLDIGTQNLYRADADRIVAFIRRFNDVYDPESLRSYAEKLSLGSQFYPEIGGINGAWLGDLLMRMGLNYESFDIFDGYRTTIFDLNRDDLDPGLAGTFDLVLNAGTTEHVLNQFNCFKVIHEAATVGGLIYHSLPMTAHLDHGYFNYNPKIHFEIAAANGYEIVWAKIDGPEGDESVAERILDTYSRLGWTRDYERSRARWESRGIPSSAFAVLLRKTADAPFRAPMETSTTAGPVSSRVGEDAFAGPAPSVAEIRETEQALVKRLNADLRPTFDEVMAAIAAHAQVKADWPSPLRLEKYALELALEAEAERGDLRTRLVKVDALLADAYPLSTFAEDESLGLAPLGSREDEATAIAAMPADDAQFARLVRLWWDYFRQGEEDRFPLDLEYLAARGAMARRPDNPEIKVWLGRILAKLLPEQAIAKAGA